MVLAAEVAAPAADVTTAPAAADGEHRSGRGCGRDRDGIGLAEDGARWENGYGEKFFQVVGTVTNDGSCPVRAVRIRVELLDESGKVVATFDGWQRARRSARRPRRRGRTRGARALAGTDRSGPERPLPLDVVADETPKFASHRVRVLTVLPPA